MEDGICAFTCRIQWDVRFAALLRTLLLHDLFFFPFLAPSISLPLPLASLPMFIARMVLSASVCLLAYLAFLFNNPVPHIFP